MTFENIPTIQLDNDFNVDLSYLADLASVDFSAENMRYSSVSSSVDSYTESVPLSPTYDDLLNCAYYTATTPSTPQSYSSVGSVPSPPPQFFPENFNPDAVWNQHYNNYIESNKITAENTSFQLSSISKSSLKMKRKRASRSKCPCVKCCSARVNGFPSPINHSCVVKNCTKSYTRPAHLRSHLKSHENQGTLKCDMCSQSFMKAEMLINHMFDHGNEMRLF